MCLICRILLGMTLMASCGRALAQAQQSSEGIESALGTRQFDRALELLRTALKKAPDDPHLWTLEGVAYAGVGDQKLALSSFANALKTAPDYLPALQRQAQIEYESGAKAAVPVLRHILRLQPNDPTSNAMLAVLEYRQGNCAAAVQHFAKSGQLLDSQIDGLHAYATCLVRLKQLDAAIPVFQRAVALEPDSAQERELLASIQLMAHKPKDALATLGPLLPGDSNSGVLQLAANAYEDSGDTDKAVASLRQAILIDPKDVESYMSFAYIAYAHQSFQVGINVLNDGIEQLPDSAQLYFSRGVLYVQVADYVNAEKDFEKAYALDPNESLTAAAQGLLAVQENDLDRALSSVKQRLRTNPNDPVLLYLQADVLTQNGVETGTPEFSLALRSAERSVALRPTLAPAREVLAKLYMQAGKNEQAIAQTRKALEIDPKNQTSVYRLIQLLRKTGSNAEIPGLLKKLAELRQDDTKALRQRYAYKLVEGDTQ